MAVFIIIFFLKLRGGGGGGGVVWGGGVTGLRSQLTPFTHYTKSLQVVWSFWASPEILFSTMNFNNLTQAGITQSNKTFSFSFV